MPKNTTRIDFLPGGTLDTAEIRRRLREVSDEHGWSLMLRLRVIAAFTALAETLMPGEPQQRLPSVISLHIEQHDHRFRIEYHVDVRLDVIRSRFPAAHWRLKRASDELEITASDEYDHITMRLWS